MINQFMKIGDFAELSAIPRKNLIEYDKKRILMPAFIDSDNQYRYYSYRQLDTAMIIKMLRELDMPLKEIKEYIENRSPAEFIRLCENQKEKIQRRINGLRQMDMVLDAHISKTLTGMKINEQEIYQKECEEELIFIGNPLPPLTASIELWSYFHEFLGLCAEAEIPTGFPSGIVVAQNQLRPDKEQTVKYFYCKLPSEFKANRIKPAGLYVIGHDYQDYTFSNKYYEKLFDYIKSNSLTIIGDGYEFYLFDELSFLEPNRYLVQIAIPVKSNKV